MCLLHTLWRNMPSNFVEEKGSLNTEYFYLYSIVFSYFVKARDRNNI